MKMRLLTLSILLASGSAWATTGSLDSPGTPTSESSKMYSLQDIYNRLNSGVAGSQAVYTGPTSGPTAPASISLNTIMDKAPEAVTDNRDGARPQDVLSGKKFWGLRTDGTWGPQSGILVLTFQNLSAETTVVAGGQYEETDLTEVDTDLKSANIKKGISIFGIPGDDNVVDTSAGSAVAGDLVDGKIAYVAGVQIVGTIPNIDSDQASTGQDAVDSKVRLTAPEGYYDGSDRVTASYAQIAALSSALVEGNLRAGVDIFGVVGSNQVVDTSDATATATDILDTKTAYVGGNEVTGTIPVYSEGQASTDQALCGTSVARLTQEPLLCLTAPQGYYGGSVPVTATYPQVATLGGITSGNVLAGATLFGVAGDANNVNTVSGTADAQHLLMGKKAFVKGAEVTGSMPNHSETAMASLGQTVEASKILLTPPEGYYNGTDAKVSATYAEVVELDTNLASGNIHKGITIFGVTGNSNVVNTDSGDVSAADITTGKVAWSKGYEIIGTNTWTPSCADGTLSSAARWCDNEDGTLTDMTTGLLWLKNANCFGLKPWLQAASPFNDAQTAVGTLSNGSCELTDGSMSGMWRLPTFEELVQATEGSERINTQATTPFFQNLQSSSYWTSTISATDNSTVRLVYPEYQSSFTAPRTGGTAYILPVRNPVRAETSSTKSTLQSRMIE